MQKITKEKARKELRKIRKNLSAAERSEADEEIASAFFAEFSNFDSYVVYNSVRDEASTKGMIEGLLSMGKKVFLPRVEGDNIAAIPFGECERGAFGVEEPKGEEYLGKIDVAIVPLLGVNVDGYRMGYGRGYFDRFLAGRDCLKVGIGYAVQFCDFDADPWDVKLDCFVSEKGITSFSDVGRE